MTIQIKHLAAIIGGCLLAAGLLLGFLPVKADGISCGTALTGQSNDAEVSDLTNAMIGLPGTNTKVACADSLSSRKATSFAIGVPGMLLLAVGGWLVMAGHGTQGAQPWQPAKSSSSPTT
jgi:hypothetical protein